MSEDKELMENQRKAEELIQQTIKPWRMFSITGIWKDIGNPSR